MESISIEATEATPSIKFSPDEGLLVIEGRSHPENAKKFYGPLINWCESYVQDPPEKTTFKIQLEHFNTISSKALLDVFRSLQPIREQDKELVVDWYYESDDEELLVTLLSDESPQVRHRAAESLGDLRCRGAIEAIRKLATDPVADVRQVFYLIITTSASA